jgi:hypothetical protein
MYTCFLYTLYRTRRNAYMERFSSAGRLYSGQATHEISQRHTER